MSGQPVCPSCAPYLSPLTDCTECGESVRKSFAAKIGDRVCCRKCVSRLDHDGIDVGVHKPKPTVQQGEHKCPQCGNLTSGSGQRWCRDCYWKRRAIKLSELQAVRLEQTWVSRLWEAFAGWLIRTASPMKAAGSMFTSGDAFVEFDNRFDSIAQMTPESLLNIGGPEWLRKHGRVSYFLAYSKIASISDLEREKWAESRRVREMLKESPEPYRLVAEEFLTHCRSESEPSEKTLRVYLRAALTLMQSTRKQLQDIDEKAIAAFLKKHPGHRHSVHRFVTYLKASGRAPNAKMPKVVRKYKPTYTQDILDRVQAFESEFAKTSSSARKRALTAASVSVIFGLPLAHCLRMSRDDIDLSCSRCRFRVNGSWYDCDAVSEKMIRKIYSLAPSEGRLFPGRLPGDCLSVTGAVHHIQIAMASF